MLSAPITKTKTRRIAEKRSATPPPPPLVLVAANYDTTVLELFLTFDRAIDITSIDVSAFSVQDGEDGNVVAGFGTPDIGTPNQALVYMVWVGDYGGPDIRMTAGAGNGIVAADDGGSWAGAVDMVLPFG